MLTKFGPLLLLLIVACIFFYQVILFGKIPLPTDALVGAHVPWVEIKWEGFPAGVPIKNQEITDAISQFYPWRSLAADFWKVGKLPLWNSYMFSGAPFLATWHSASLYPLNFLYLIFSDVNAWTLLLFLQILLALVFTYILLSYLGNSKIASVCGAISFAFSGYMIAWLEFSTGGHAGLWLPALLYFELRLIKERNNLFIPVIGLIFFMIFTAGDFQIPLYISLIYIFALVFVTFEKKLSLKKAISKLAKPILAFVLGICLSAVQLLPSILLFKQSIRISDPYIKEYNYGILDWSKAANFVWPDIFGNIVTRNYWGRFGFHEYLAFSGITLLLFSIYALFIKKNRIEIFILLILVVSLLFAFPTPLAFIPYKLSIPGLATSSASRIIFVFNFCLAVLGARGISEFLNKGSNKKALIVAFYFLVATGGVFLGFAICFLYFKLNVLPGEEVRKFIDIKVSLKNMLPGILVSLALYLVIAGKTIFKFKKSSNFVNILGVTLICITSFEMLMFAWKNTPFSLRRFLYPETETTKFLSSNAQYYRISGSGLPLNYFLMYGLRSAEGYDSLYPYNNSKWYSLINSGTPNHLAGRYGEINKYTSPLIDYASVKYIVDYKKNPLNKIISSEGVLTDGIELPRYKEVHREGRVIILENTNVLPKAFLTTDYEVFESEVSVEKSMLADKSSQKIYLTNLPQKPNFGLNKLDYKINNYKEGPNTISFDVESNSDAFLSLSESYSKDWKVSIDGKSSEIFNSNIIFMSTLVPAGTHNVVFNYSPDSFKVAKIVSLLGITVSLIILGNSLKRKS